MSAAQHTFTPGPWGWFGNEYGFYLATQFGGRRFVMDFARMGMQRAQPRFQVGGVMVDAKDLAVFEVGKRGIVGMKAARLPGSDVYRTDIVGFDHADSQLIAAAPDLYEALFRLLPFCRAETDPADPNYDPLHIAAIERARAALATATGAAT